MSLWTRPDRAPTRPGRRSGVAAAVILLVTVAIIATTAAVRRGDDPDPTVPDSGQSGPPEPEAGVGPSSTPAVERTLPVVPPTGGVVLPAGKAAADGYQVGFPHTDAGAVAAAVEITRAQVGFNYEQAAAAARAYAAPDDIAMLTSRAREAVGYRRHQLGIAPLGAVAAPAAFALTPFAFQIRKMDTSCYAVTVLSLASTTSTRGRMRNVYYAGTQLIRWVDDDWKTAAGGSAERQRLLNRPPPAAVGPRDPQFRRAGWITVTTPEVSP